MAQANPDRVTFVDYKFIREGEDIQFDEELTMESLRFYEGKTFKVQVHEGRIWLRFVEDWDMMPDLPYRNGKAIDFLKESRELELQYEKDKQSSS